jgi:hypothetical protein
MRLKLRNEAHAVWLPVIYKRKKKKKDRAKTSQLKPKQTEKNT